MNNSIYLSYCEHILYKFNNQRYQIPVLIYPHLEIQLLDTITWAPKQYKEHIDPIYPSFQDTSFVGLVNLSRPAIHNPYKIVIHPPSTKSTKAERLGTSTASSSTSSRKFVFTRGLKNIN